LACKFTVKPLNTNFADRPGIFRIQGHFILNPFKFWLLPTFFNYNLSKTPVGAGALIVLSHAASGVAVTLYVVRRLG
jgi:hypothetical protein